MHMDGRSQKEKEIRPSLSRVRRWNERINRSQRVLWALFWASFAETLLVPIPIELVLIPFMVTNRHRLWRSATVVTAGCLCAAMVGYGIGYLFFDTLGKMAIDQFGWSEQLKQFQSLFDQYGFWAIVAVGVMPIPFQVALLTAGAAGYSVVLFLIAATFARSIRYYGLAVLVYLFGDRAEVLWRENKTLAGLLLTLIIVGLFVVALWL